MMTKTEITRTRAGFAVRVVPAVLGTPTETSAGYGKRPGGIAGIDAAARPMS
ncbi:hypothetical protein [Humibacter ginsenosidimutans]|uniref:hypothetical protein n=1 Tax=Humibacter ginsenosidimutans TaxID=2599293 RepID=UPI00143CC9FB|nr:hypothetical protein [Humibacter ginsenosidimutans]